ncbi:MAG: hypothetical protein FWG68_04350 [Defluviitaleaceae bacterium]|nr:hypothetical protein [Defluviitaleaceae bacterium]
MKKANFQASVDRALHLYRRYLSATSDHDKASRGYYACYHAAIAAVELKSDFEILRKAENASYHAALRNIYPRYYGKTVKKGKPKIQIVAHNVSDSLELWHDVRIVADYIVFGEHFSEQSIQRTRRYISHMADFVEMHLQYFVDNFSQLLTEEQTAEIGEILPPPEN